MGSSGLLLRNKLEITIIRKPPSLTMCRNMLLNSGPGAVRDWSLRFRVPTLRFRVEAVGPGRPWSHQEISFLPEPVKPCNSR